MQKTLSEMTIFIYIKCFSDNMKDLLTEPDTAYNSKND